MDSDAGSPFDSAVVDLEQAQPNSPLKKFY